MALTGSSRKQRRVPRQAAARELSAAASISGPPLKRPSRLRLVRVARGYTLLTLARLVRINVGTLSLIENGLSAPTPTLVARLGGALRVPGRTLFSRRPGGKDDHADAETELEVALSTLERYAATGRTRPDPPPAPQPASAPDVRAAPRERQGSR